MFLLLEIYLSVGFLMSCKYVYDKFDEDDTMGSMLATTVFIVLYWLPCLVAAIKSTEDT